MPCPTPFDAMKTATESLSTDLMFRASQQSLWLNVIPKGTYKKGTGVTQTVFTMANSEPTSDVQEWDDITLTNGQISLNGDTDTSACDTAYTDVQVGFIEQTYGPKKFDLRGPVICQDNLTFNHNSAQFLLGYEKQLAKFASRVWEFEMRNQYMFFSEKYINGDKVGEASTAISALDIDNFQVSRLTQDILDSVAYALIDSDAVDPDKDGYVAQSDAGPLFTLYIGMEASSNIIKNDPELRQDARFASMGKDASDPLGLFRRIGANRIVNNFRHVVTTLPPRFNLVNGVFVQVPTFTTADVTQGVDSPRNPAWINAEYEAAIVVLPSVFEAEVVQPSTGAGSIKFEPKNYLGEWEFVTGAFRWNPDCADPQERLGRHFARFEYAPKPMFPSHGKTLIFARCSQDRHLSYCS